MDDSVWRTIFGAGFGYGEQLSSLRHSPCRLNPPGRSGRLAWGSRPLTSGCTVSEQVKKKEFLGWVEFVHSAPLPYSDDPEEYVADITGEAIATDDGDVEYTVGKTILNLACIDLAINNGVMPFHVCDAHSETMVDIYRVLFRDDGEWNEELGLEPRDRILFIDDLKIDNGYADSDLKDRLIETAANTFAASGITMACRDSFGLSSKEWYHLGFGKVPNSHFILKQGALRGPPEYPGDRNGSS
jgi:hypothetical protein